MIAQRPRRPGPPSRWLRAAASIAASLVALVAWQLAVGALVPRSAGHGGPPPASPSTSPSQTVPPTPRHTPAATPTRSATPTPSPSPSPPPATPRPTVAPTAIPTPDDALPGGRYLDLLTARRAYADWPITMLDTIYMLPADYAPGDLVDSSAAGLNGGYPVRSIVVADLRAMARDARAAGVPLGVVSGYRSHAQQVATFSHWVAVSGYDAALRTSARPGHSEHQLGTTLDFTSSGGAAPWTYPDWAATPAGAWMKANAWRYGFVMSYPDGAFATTGYDYEPWHYRYVGRTQAAAITASGLAPREFLWRNR
jgi:D-alanyl-D-alanine carboxypeptidase